MNFFPTGQKAPPAHNERGSPLPFQLALPDYQQQQRPAEIA